MLVIYQWKATYCTADGDIIMMGKKNGCLNLKKGDNFEMLLLHCIIHRENIVLKIIYPIFN